MKAHTHEDVESKGKQQKVKMDFAGGKGGTVCLLVHCAQFMAKFTRNVQLIIKRASPKLVPPVKNCDTKTLQTTSNLKPQLARQFIAHITSHQRYASLPLQKPMTEEETDFVVLHHYQQLSIKDKIGSCRGHNHSSCLKHMKLELHKMAMTC